MPPKPSSGIVEGDEMLGEERMIPQSFRPDGTLRPAQRVRAGFTPQEDIKSRFDYFLHPRIQLSQQSTCTFLLKSNTWIYYSSSHLSYIAICIGWAKNNPWRK
jgi:hypothetical protein